MSEQILFQLTKPINLSVGGEQQDVDFIELKKPTAKQIHLLAPIKQACTQAIQHAQTLATESQVEAAKAKKEEGGDNDLSGDEIIYMMEQTPGIDMQKVMLHAEELLTKSGLFLIGGEEKSKLNGLLFAQLDGDDFYSLLGEFLKNFVIAALMK